MVTHCKEAFYPARGFLDHGSRPKTQDSRLIVPIKGITQDAKSKTVS